MFVEPMPKIQTIGREVGVRPTIDGPHVRDVRIGCIACAVWESGKGCTTLR